MRAASRKIQEKGLVKDSKPRSEFSLTKANQAGRKSALPAFIIIAVVVCLVVVGIVKSGAADRNSWLRSQAQPVSLGGASTARDKWSDLHGKSMGEWMKENKVESQMMKDRQQRLWQTQSGQQP